MKLEAKDVGDEDDSSVALDRDLDATALEEMTAAEDAEQGLTVRAKKKRRDKVKRKG